MGTARLRGVLAAVLALALAGGGAGCWRGAAGGAVDEGAYAGPVRLACVGDSLTANPGNWTEHAAGWLGSGWTVGNFGLGGATALSFGDRPYAAAKLAEVLAFRPDVVVVLLGTNDSKPRHWYYREEFARDYGALLEALKGAESHPRVWACLPPPAFPGQWGIDEGRICEVGEAIRREARKHGVPTIDLHGPLEGMGECFPDQVHPDGRGSAEMARIIYRALKGRDPEGRAN